MLLAIISKRGNMLQFLIFVVHFMCLMELPIPTSLVNRSPLIRFHMETKGCFKSFINGDVSQYTIAIFCQTDLGQEAIRLTGGDGGSSILAVKHIQTLKVVSYK